MKFFAIILLLINWILFFIIRDQDKAVENLKIQRKVLIKKDSTNRHSIMTLQKLVDSAVYFTDIKKRNDHE